jgi:hypothetical protein
VPTALATTGFSFNDEPTVNSKDELTAATSGTSYSWHGHPARAHGQDAHSTGAVRTVISALVASHLAELDHQAASRGRACPTLPGSAAMYKEGTASRPPTAKGLADTRRSLHQLDRHPAPNHRRRPLKG